jgi:hypothetical protein
VGLRQSGGNLPGPLCGPDGSASHDGSPRELEGSVPHDGSPRGPAPHDEASV